MKVEVIYLTEVYTKVINMDTAISEHVVSNIDGSYTIFLNARLTFESRLKSYEHAMRHILNDDFNSELTADEIEKARHAG